MVQCARTERLITDIMQHSTPQGTDMKKKYLDKLYEKRQSAVATIARLKEAKDYPAEEGNVSEKIDSAKVMCVEVQLSVIDDLIEEYVFLHK